MVSYMGLINLNVRLFCKFLSVFFSHEFTASARLIYSSSLSLAPLLRAGSFAHAIFRSWNTLLSVVLPSEPSVYPRFS